MPTKRSLVIICAIIGVSAALCWHQHQVTVLYQGFAIHTRNVALHQSIALNDQQTLTLHHQGLTHGHFRATLTLHTRAASRLSLAHWYLYEGPNNQPNQFLDPTINGKVTHDLTPGTNRITVATNIAPHRPTYQLAIAINDKHGRYRILYFQE
ncbi:hypothetical protein [Lacticaseibacillus manihotivorans]|uniref:Uncharacterized protein n=1 Tax=Lacticaseibacillus manihotivorans TaxID=88233 RepID=A0A5P8JPI2_9LACO|nr:hypothetical protein [Lacticaseibacillus manihotivorans]QFQ90571.1 hypothetical protein LM010_03605 [Lacticaseibacillus manihotivorans]